MIKNFEAYPIRTGDQVEVPIDIWNHSCYHYTKAPTVVGRDSLIKIYNNNNKRENFCEMILGENPTRDFHERLQCALWKKLRLCFPKSDGKFSTIIDLSLQHALYWNCSLRSTFQKGPISSLLFLGECRDFAESVSFISFETIYPHWI